MAPYPRDQEAALHHMLRQVLQNHLTTQHLSLEALILVGVWLLGGACLAFCRVTGAPLPMLLGDVRGWLIARVRALEACPRLTLADAPAQYNAEDDAAIAQAVPVFEALAQLVDEAYAEQGLRIDCTVNATLGLMTDVLHLAMVCAEWEQGECEAFIGDELHHDLTAYTESLQAHRREQERR